MEHRTHRRRRTLKKGLLILDIDGTVVECIVRNIGSGGAGIWLHSWRDLPPKFDLMIPVDNIRIGVRLAWRRGQEIGVAFVGASQLASRPRLAWRQASRDVA